MLSLEVGKHIRLMGHEKREDGWVERHHRGQVVLAPDPARIAQLEGALGFQTGQLKRDAVSPPAAGRHC
jgi:hypothetical protein